MIKSNTEALPASPLLARKQDSLLRAIFQHRYLYLMGLPGMLFFLVFKYLPMPGIVIAFQDYSVYRGITGSEWVGFDHFIQLFKDPDFVRLFRNSITLSLLSLCMFPLPIVLALLLNELRNEIVKRWIQTFVYLPHFISWVIVISLTYIFFSKEVGLLNNLIASWGWDRKELLFNNDAFYPLLIGQEQWKNVGWGSIIFLAAISGVDPSLYESARMDGAGKLRQMWSVTLPSIMPTVIIMFILALGNTLDNNFEQVYLMQNPINTEFSEVFETYVYKQGIKEGQFSYTAAVGIFKSVIGLILVLGSNYLVRKRGYEGLY
ncbi:ABC transporter permease [Paenibacillus sp. GCM10023252]|uniref:ABC transporter permease n=1 Tax=Paenibacillus sp. GCM10023252 TaxID=3252649 RepID=UPI00361598E3